MLVPKIPLRIRREGNRRGPAGMICHACTERSSISCLHTSRCLARSQLSFHVIVASQRRRALRTPEPWLPVTTMVRRGTCRRTCPVGWSWAPGSAALAFSLAHLHATGHSQHVWQPQHGTRSTTQRSAPQAPERHACGALHASTASLTHVHLTSTAAGGSSMPEETRVPQLQNR